MDGALPSNGNSNPILPCPSPPTGVGDMQSPNSPLQSSSAMDVSDDISSSNNDLSTMNLNPPFFPVNANDPQRLNSPPSPTETDDINHPEVIGPRDTLAIVSRMPSPFCVNLAPNLPSNLSQSINLPGNTPAAPSSYVPTSGTGTTLTHPPLASAGNGAFNLTGVLGGFISENTRAYWESVPGGAMWITMVKNYLVLQTIAPSKDVCIVSYFTF